MYKVGLMGYLSLLFQFLSLFMIIIGEYPCLIFYNVLTMVCLITYVLGVVRGEE